MIALSFENLQLFVAYCETYVLCVCLSCGVLYDVLDGVLDLLSVCTEET